MANGNILSGIPSLIGTAGTIILSGVVVRELARISSPRSFRKTMPTRRRSLRLTEL